jgi:hypothetical protein
MTLSTMRVTKTIHTRYTKMSYIGDKTQERADSCLDFEEVREAKENGIGPAKYIKENYGIDPTEYDSEGELAKAMSQSRRGVETTAMKARGLDARAASSGFNRQHEDMCKECLTNEEIQQAKARETLPSDFIRNYYDLDTTEYKSSDMLMSAMSRKVRDGEANTDRHRSGSTWVSG